MEKNVTKMGWGIFPGIFGAQFSSIWSIITALLGGGGEPRFLFYEI
jgi:hypothetical protein